MFTRAAIRFAFPRLLCLTVIASCTHVAAAQTAPPLAAPEGDEKADRALWISLQKQNAPRLRTDAAQVSDQYIEFLRAGAKAAPALDPSVAIDAWDITIDLVDRGAKNGAKALELCDEALALYGTQPSGASLLAAKTRVMLYDDHPQEAQSFVVANWTQIAAAPARYARRILWYDCLALQAQNKSDAIPTTLKKMLVDNPAFLDENFQSTNAWMYRRLVSGLVAQGKTDEALAWAKVRWMECPFNDQSVQGAAAMLAQVWQTQSQNKTPPQALGQFINAQGTVLPTPTGAGSTTAANPLTSVATPTLDGATVQAQLLRLTSQMGEPLHDQKTHARINLLMLAGEWGQAMTQARELWMNPGTAAQGVQEIARVYKAHDLNLVRANAFLDWNETNQGPNPVDQFLKENPAQIKPVGIGGAA